VPFTRFLRSATFHKPSFSHLFILRKLSDVCSVTFFIQNCVAEADHQFSREIFPGSHKVSYWTRIDIYSVTRIGCAEYRSYIFTHIHVCSLINISCNYNISYLRVDPWALRLYHPEALLCSLRRRLYSGAEGWYNLNAHG
jgi:hypothetical protein